MSDQIPPPAVCLTVLLPEPVGPMTLIDIKLDISLSRVVSRTLSRYHLFLGPLCSPSHEILELSGSALCPSQIVVLSQSGAEVLGLPDDPDGVLCLSEAVVPCWSEAGSASLHEVLRKPELSGGVLCPCQVVVLRQSGVEGVPSHEVPRLPAEFFGLPDGADGALCPSQVVAPCWSEAESAPDGTLCLSEDVAPCWSEAGRAPSQKVLRLPEVLDSSLNVLYLFFLPGPCHFASTFSRREASGNSKLAFAGSNEQ